MKKLSCNLTGIEFGISDSEVDYYANRSLEHPHISEIERMRQGLSVIPLPIFNNHTLRPPKSVHKDKVHTTAFDIKTDVDTLSLDSSIWTHFSKFREYFSVFTQSFRVSDYIVNYGDPLLYGSVNVLDSLDCNFCYNIADCYDCILCADSKQLLFSRCSTACENSYFLDNCIDCKDCMFCSDLKGSRYCAFNSQLTESEYKGLLDKLQLEYPTALEFEKERFANFLINRPSVVSRQMSSSFSKGFPIEIRHDFDVNFFSRNISRGSSNFCCSDLNESFNCALAWGEMKDLYASSLLYGSGRKITRSIGCFGELEDIDLCIGCSNSTHLFACIGLSNTSYCIFNRTVKKNEYAMLVQKLRFLIREQGVSGKNFFVSEKLIPYNKSLAGLVLPLSKVQAELIGFSWDHTEERMYVDQNVSEDVPVCEITGTTFFVTEREKIFLERNKIAYPVRSPLQRFKDRVRNLEIANMKKVQCAISNTKACTWDPHNRVVVSQNPT